MSSMTSMKGTEETGSFRKIMTPVHTWCGLVLGWILYFVFVTGTVGYFDSEIDSWAKPEVPFEVIALDRATETAEAWLTTNAPNADSWLIRLPSDRYTGLKVSWRYDEAPEGKEKNGSEFLDVGTGEPLVVRDTDGGQTLYKMHYNLHYMPRIMGQYLVGIASMFMLVAIITGVIIHKKIFREFFTFRPGKGQRSWLDFHNITSVLALPFHLMITYSGLLFFGFAYLPGIVLGVYGSPKAAEEAIEAAFVPPHEHVERGGEAAPLAPLLPMVQRTVDLWQSDEVASISIQYPGDINSRVSVDPRPRSLLMSFTGNGKLYYGVSGEPLDQGELIPTSPLDMYVTLLGLHEGTFAGIGLRWVYFLSGIFGTAMIATGLILWTAKRNDKLAKRGQALGRGHRLVEVLNIGTLIGLLVGIACFFLANRLLPLGLEDRHEWELHALFISWLVMLFYAAVRPMERAWTESILIAAIAYALVPIVSAFTTERNLVHSILVEDWVFVGFDLTMLATALCFAAALTVRQRKMRGVTAASSAGSGSDTKMLETS